MKQGELLMVERSRKEQRECLLFSDCLVWLAREGNGGTNTTAVWDISGGAKPSEETGSNMDGEERNGERPGLVRSRSKFENELPHLRNCVAGAPSTPLPVRHSVYPAGLTSTPEEHEKWEYKGKAALIDLEVVVPGKVSRTEARESEERKLEVLGPEGSFTVYSGGFCVVFHVAFFITE